MMYSKNFPQCWLYSQNRATGTEVLIKEVNGRNWVTCLGSWSQLEYPTKLPNAYASERTTRLTSRKKNPQAYA